MPATQRRFNARTEGTSMSESTGDGDSRFMSGFLIGFVVGVLICLGAGAAYFFVWGQRAALREQQALEQARQAEAKSRLELEAFHDAKRRAEKKAREKTDAKGPRDKVARLQMMNIEKALINYKL